VCGLPSTVRSYYCNHVANTNQIPQLNTLRHASYTCTPRVYSHRHSGELAPTSTFVSNHRDPYCQIQSHRLPRRLYPLKRMQQKKPSDEPMKPTQWRARLCLVMDAAGGKTSRYSSPVLQWRDICYDVNINVGSDREGVKPSPLTSSMVRSSAMFMCGTNADVSLAVSL
jgi:hypothetical protein